MHYLIFDTETSGLPRNYKAHYSELNNWPRVVQLAFVVCDSEGKQVDEYCQIIRPDNFVIPPDMIHGISHEQALVEGISIGQALSELELTLMGYDKITLVAHNISFDRPIVASEFERDGSYQTARVFYSYYPQYCTMMQSVNFCAIKNAKGGYKWPRLTELHERLFGESFDGAHDALADVKATAKCFFELKKLGVIK